MRPAFVLAAASLALCSASAVAQDGRVADVAPLVVRPQAEAPVPKVGEGAPLFNAPEIVRMQDEARRVYTEAIRSVRICATNGLDNSAPVTLADMMAQTYREEQEAAAKVQALAGAAAQATEAAQAARRAMAAGSGDEATLVRTELERQKAVNALEAAREALAEASESVPVMQKAVAELNIPATGDAIGWHRTAVMQVSDKVREFRSRRLQERSKPAPSPFADLVIRKVVVARDDEAKGGPELSITGEILNPRTAAASVPPLEFSQLDGYGFKLDTVVAEALVNSRIAAGAAVPFAYRFKPKMGRAEKVEVGFGPWPPPPPRRSVTAPLAPVSAPAGITAFEARGFRPMMTTSLNKGGERPDCSN